MNQSLDKYARLFYFILLILAGCTTDFPTIYSPKQTSIKPENLTDTPIIENPLSITETPIEIQLMDNSIVTTIGYTHLMPNGNRFVLGQGKIPDYQTLDIKLERKPVWVNAVPTTKGSIWIVVLENGDVKAYSLNDDDINAIPIKPNKTDPDTPPLLVIQDNSPTLLEVPSPQKSRFTHPVLLPKNGSIVYISKNGNLILMDEEYQEIGLLAIKALPDARILTDDEERLLVLSDGTSAYNHGVLGDEIEATSITLIETTPQFQVINKISLPKGKVVEGTSPIWTDLNGDLKREIIVTISDHDEGAQIAVFTESGELLALGPSIGQGYRWRHQIGVAPFGPNGELELVDVLTPHIGGVIEFYQLRGEVLNIISEFEGFTSHIIGSRNLDMAATGDFDGDGNVELLLPNQNMTSLGAIQRVPSGVILDWITEIDGRMSTNLGAVTLNNGQIIIGVGVDNGSLRLWVP